MDTIVTAISVIGAILIIAIIIMVHELGHFSIGRACKIKVVEFAVGFGPKIKSWVKNDIIYSIRWILLGGYTKFYGEDEDIDDKLAFNNQPAGRRALTIAAGPVFNIILALLLAVVALTCFGEYAPTVGEVWEGSPAEEAGLMEDDVVVAMNGVDIDFYMEISAAGRAANEEYLNVTVLRDGQELTFNVPKVYYERIPEANRGTRSDEDMIVNANMAGFSFGVQRVHYGFFEAIALSFKWTYFVLKETLLAFFGLLSGQGTEDVGGFVEIVRQLSYALQRSLEFVLQLGAAINASLAIANLLPLPALDGGRLVFIAIEKIRRKPVPRNVEGIIHFVGFVLLFGVMVLFIFRDVAGMVGGG